MKITLRDYQENCLNSVITEFKRKNKQLVVLPTGSGKTVIFCHLINNLGGKTLILAHTRELLDQIHSTMRSQFPDISCEVYKSRTSVSCQVVICSIQSARSPKALNAFMNHGFKLIIVDECHRAAAKSYRKILDGLHFNNKLLGFTATPFRTDRQSINEIFGFPSMAMSLIDMIKEGFLSDFKGFKVKTNVSLQHIRRSNGDFRATHLAPVINVKGRNEIIVNQYLKISPDEKAIAFCIDVKHAYDLKKAFEDKGITCECLEGKISKSERKNILSRFKSGETKVLTNCNLLTEGFDEPSVTSLLMARPTLSKGLYIQMIGRGSRLFPGKDHCKVLEFTDNDFDVCCLEELVNASQRKISMKENESLLEYKKRIEKELLDSHGDIVIQQHQLIKRETYFNREASPWQRQELERRGIHYIEPLMEITANYLLEKGM